MKIFEVYQTEDGSIFNTRKEAEKYIEKLQMREKLKEYEVSSLPRYLPGLFKDDLKMIDMGYKWYRVENEDDYAFITKMLETRAILQYTGNSIDEINYPDYLGYNQTYHKVVFYKDLLRQNKVHNKQFEYFVERFEEIERS